jgi:hypothetical protein
MTLFCQITTLDVSVRNKQIKRNIYLWKKANIDEIKSDTIQLSNKITCDTNTSSKNNTDIEEIWNQ